MSVRIICINTYGNEEPSYENLESLCWENEKTGVKGRTPANNMLHWLTVQGGKAYVVNNNREVSMLGSFLDRDGNRVIRTFRNGEWNDDLLQIKLCKPD